MRIPTAVAASASAALLTGCTAGVGGGSLPPDGPVRIGEAVGGAVGTVGAVIGNPLLVMAGDALTQAIPYVLTLLGGGYLTRRAIKKKDAEPYTAEDVASLEAAKAGGSKPVA